MSTYFSAFYQKALARDSRRVADRFKDALARKPFEVRQAGASVDTISSHLKAHGPCIVLVNANLMRPGCQNHAFQRLFFGGCCSGGSDSRCVHDGDRSAAFQGHFILVVGCDEAAKKIIYHNPSRPQGPSDISFDVFDLARKAHGTDEDVIYLYRDKDNKTKEKGVADKKA